MNSNFGFIWLNVILKDKYCVCKLNKSRRKKFKPATWITNKIPTIVKKTKQGKKYGNQW